MICAHACLMMILAAQSPGTGYAIRTVAGTDFVGDGGAATAAILSQAEGVAVDARGNIYVADADDNRVRRISPDGTIQTIAGTGTAGYSGDGGPAALAQLSHPYGLALDAAGNLYIADLGNARVRRVSTDGSISTAAGGDDKLIAPRNVALDAAGALYISDFGAHIVYRIVGEGPLLAFAGAGKAGAGGDGGSAALAQLNSPAGLAADATGALYIADSGNNRIRKISRGVIASVLSVDAPTGVAMGHNGTLYIAGHGYFGTAAARIGGLASARDVAAGADGNLYVTTGPLLERVGPNGALSILAGTGASRYYGGDGGPAAAARLHSPGGLARDGAGNLYVADTANHRIRRISPSGFIATFAGTGEAGSKGDGGMAGAAQLNSPRGLAFDPAGNLYIADRGNNRIRKISTAGIVSTVVDSLRAPEAVAIGAGHAIYVADTGNNRVLRVTPAGDVAIAASVPAPTALATSPSGALYIADSSRVVKLSESSGALVTLAGELDSPRGLAFADAGLLIAESGANRLRLLNASGALVTLAGIGAAGFAGDGGPATSAQLNAPSALAVDGDGAIFIADSGNNRVRELSPPAVGAVASISVVHAATLAPGPVAPGEIVTIYGSNFEPGRTQVFFDDAPATLLYTGVAQINAVAPAGLKPGSSVGIAVAVNGSPVASVTAAVAVASAVPGLFTASGGTGPAAALNEDGSVNSVENPAARGAIISLWATGAGQDPSAAAVKIGNYLADVLYAGSAPGFIGLVQLNVRVPAGFAPAGQLPVTLSLGSASSPPGVTISVR